MGTGSGFRLKGTSNSRGFRSQSLMQYGSFKGVLTGKGWTREKGRKGGGQIVTIPAEGSRRKEEGG